MAKIVLVLLLAVLAGQATGALVSLVPVACAEECTGDECPGGNPAGQFPPLCTHCPCCYLPQLFLPATPVGLTLRSIEIPLPILHDEFRQDERASEILHVPKSLA